MNTDTNHLTVNGSGKTMSRGCKFLHWFALHTFVSLVVLFGTILAAASETVLHDRDALCASQSAGRMAFRNVIVLATSQPSYDLTQVPGYADLDKPTKKWISSLQAIQTSSSAPAQALQSQLLAQVPPITCHHPWWVL